MSDLEVKLAEVDARGKSNTHRIDRLEQNTEAIQKLATSVELLAQSMDGMKEEQKAQGDRLAALEREPAERWNSMKRTIFTAAVSTLSGGVVGALATLLVGAMK